MNRQLLHTPEGVRDIYGNEYARKLEVESRLRRCAGLYGYEEIQTPTFEFFDVFSREIGTTPSRELYKFFDKEGNTLVLRPDFTPSIARCAAMYFGEMNHSLRFSYMGNTFANTSNLQGKLKEVTQMGAELIGEDSVEADAEIISMVIEALKALGLKSFRVSVGEVEYFKGLCEEAGLDEETEYALRSFISGKNYFAAQELLDDRKVQEPYRSRLLKIADMFGDMCDLHEAREQAGNARSLAAVTRLEELYRVLKSYGVEQYVAFDLGLLSKYNYYTGVVFKAYTFGLGDAVVKGGRYDKLLRQFGKDAPAIGFCMVVDDLMEALEYQNVNYPAEESVQILSYSPQTPLSFEENLKLAQKLRQEGKRVKLVPEETSDPEKK